MKTDLIPPHPPHFAPEAATCLAETHVNERAGDHGRKEACSQHNLFVQNVESRCDVTKTWLCFLSNL